MDTGRGGAFKQFLASPKKTTAGDRGRRRLKVPSSEFRARRQ
jgi:hypothetical protein